MCRRLTVLIRSELHTDDGAVKMYTKRLVELARPLAPAVMQVFVSFFSATLHPNFQSTQQSESVTGTDLARKHYVPLFVDLILHLEEYETGEAPLFQRHVRC